MEGTAYTSTTLSVAVTDNELVFSDCPGSTQTMTINDSGVSEVLNVAYSNSDSLASISQIVVDQGTGSALGFATVTNPTGQRIKIAYDLSDCANQGSYTI